MFNYAQLPVCPSPRTSALTSLPGRIASALLAASLCCGTIAHAGSRAADGRALAFGAIPLSFEANSGQTDPRVQFVSHGEGFSLFLAPGEAYLNLEQVPSAAVANPLDRAPSGPATVDRLHLRLVGADANAAVSGSDRQSGVVNYFVGKDPAKWRSGIPTYGKVSYTAIYPGIDLVFYGNQQQLEYDFVVAPGADANRIVWQIEGARVSVDRRGDLQLAAPNGPASFKRPVLYQMFGNKKVSVEGRYVATGEQVRFRLGAYDHKKPLIIDPVLSYVTYFGAPASAYGPVNASTFIGYWDGNYVNWQGLAIDKAGNVYITGNTDAFDLPVKDAYQTSDPALKTNYRATAAYVTKINPEGTGLVYSTYLSGGSQDNTYGSSIAVDAEGNAYAAGFTDDPNFPTTPGAFQTICGAFDNNGVRTANCGTAASVNGFVTKLDPTGSKLVYSTFLGANQAFINSIAVDSEGRAYVAGSINDYCDPQVPAFECFPTTANAVQSGLDTSIESSGNTYYNGYPGFAFLTVFTSDGSGLAYSTLLGDNLYLTGAGETPSDTFGTTTGFSVALNSSNEIFLTGYTLAARLPVTSGVYQSKPQKTLPNAGPEGYVAKFNPIGSGGSTLLAYLTYLGPVTDPNNVGTYATGIAADSAGNAYIDGITNSQMFPTTKGSYDPTCGTPNFDECGVAFIAKLNPSGSDLIWSTLFGDPVGDASGVGGMGPIEVDEDENVYVAGSANGYYLFPQVNQIQPTRGNGQVFVAEFNPDGSKLLFSTLIGGLAGTQWAAGLAVDRDRNIYVAGNGNSPGVQPTKGAFLQKYPGQGYNAFVAKIAPVALPQVQLTFSYVTDKGGDVLTLSAKVSGPAFSPTPTGQVTFYEDSSILGTRALNSAGIAPIKLSNPKSGKFTFHASYAGDAFNLPSTVRVAEYVKADTTSTLKSSANPSTQGQAVIFTDKVTSPDGTPTGTVTLKKNGAILAKKALSSGAVSFSIDTLIAGTHTIVAVYSGDTTHLPSTSNAISEVTK